MNTDRRGRQPAENKPAAQNPSYLSDSLHICDPSNPYILPSAVSKAAGVRIGHAQYDAAKTGVTVIYFPDGAKTGCDISGGGPASRETTLAMSITSEHCIHAVVLSGGSAFGLAAADGVMRCLEEHGIGYDMGAAKIPLVCQSCIFDLKYGRADIRPDAGLGYEACKRALQQTDGRMGNIGAGIGASAGKVRGMERAMKTGLGVHSVQLFDIQVTAVVTVNAYGDIYDPATGKKLAGVLTKDRKRFSDTRLEWYESLCPQAAAGENTTIGVVVTNAAFSKNEMNKIASMTRSAYARCINPVGTMADGDTVYAASVGKIPADINVVGTLAAEVMAEAVKKAVLSARIPDEEFLSNIYRSR